MYVHVIIIIIELKFLQHFEECVLLLAMFPKKYSLYFVKMMNYDFVEEAKRRRHSQS